MIEKLRLSKLKMPEFKLEKKYYLPYTAVAAVIVFSAAVLLFVKDSTYKFVFIMPAFLYLIFFLILTSKED